MPCIVVLCNVRRICLSINHIKIIKMRIERFEIKKEHLDLLKNAYVSWVDCDFGAPAIDCKRPYGNSLVELDIAKILKWEIDEENGLTDEQNNLAYKLHEETKTVLQICLSQLKFETGIYENKGYSQDWVRIS